MLLFINTLYIRVSFSGPGGSNTTLPKRRKEGGGREGGWGWGERERERRMSRRVREKRDLEVTRYAANVSATPIFYIPNKKF